MNDERQEPHAKDAKSAEMFGFNAYSPYEIAHKVKSSGVTKARLPLLSQLTLAVMAGAFIGLGSLFYMIVRSDPTLGYATRQLLSGGVFCLGMVMVVVAGAELFTGNNLLVIARARGLITSAQVLRNWSVVFVGNLIGCAGLALLVFLSHHAEANDGAIAREYVTVAAAKAALPFWTAFFKGVLCNALVCLGVWMSMAGRSVVDKVIALLFPITAFVAAGFEHCIANLYIFAMALLLQDGGSATLVAGMSRNLVAVVAGNVVGGSVLVGLVYYSVYIWGHERAEKRAEQQARAKADYLKHA
jgi:formate/nitrite transporter